VLVFFENKKLLKEFLEYSKIKEDYLFVNVLYEGISDQEKNHYISLASS
jgi:hypothetical protein